MYVLEVFSELSYMYVLGVFSELSYMYVLGVSMFPLSTIVLLDCRTDPRVWYVLFYYYYINNRP